MSIRRLAALIAMGSVAWSAALPAADVAPAKRDHAKVTIATQR
jgi:hypothetical protein